MLRLAVALALVLAPAVAAADEFDTPTRAPGETPPDLELHRQPPRTERRPWEVRLGGGIGAARVVMLGEKHGALGVTVDLDALRWFDRMGAGLYVTELIAAPVMPVTMTGSIRPLSRDLAWEIEPELAVRRSNVVAPHLSVGWQATGSVGMVIARTVDSCGKRCGHVLEQSTELGASAGASLFAHVGPLAVDLGARAQADGAGDRAVALQASAGAVW